MAKFKFGPLVVCGGLLKCGPIRRVDGKLAIGRLMIQASRWPWQGYGWFPHKLPVGKKVICAPLNGNGARFGGGWAYKLGVEIGGTSVMFNLLFGIITFRIEDKKP